MGQQFIEKDRTNFHPNRRRELSQKYGEQIQALTGHNPWSALIIFFLVSTNLTIAALAQNWSWWLLVPVAYIVGATIHHALYVMIHEATHNFVAKSQLANKFWGLMCDIALVLPSSMGFRKYHLIHHRYMNYQLKDADIPLEWEARLVGNSAWKKALWLACFMFSQAIRPMKNPKVKVWDKWTVFNVLFSLAVNILIVMAFGPKALAYLFLSTFFGLGLHPFGGRWIQEHFVTKEGQETYSYYGPLNKLCFNVGYHNEHHDFMNIPWNNLPKLKKLAPEYYDNLTSYNSWVWVVWNFITNPAMSPYSRIVHAEEGSEEVNLTAGNLEFHESSL